MTNLRKLLLAGCALTVSASIAQAQFATSGDVIFFGDSLSDNGNLFATTGTANDFPGSSRFVNPGGLTWIEQLLGGTPDPTDANAVSPQNSPVQGTGVAGDVNVAFGGAFAGSGGLAAGIPGRTEQQGIFAASGGTIDVDDTVTYWAGANNFFAGLPLVTDAAGAAALGQSVGALAVNDITQLATGQLRLVVVRVNLSTLIYPILLLCRQPIWVRRKQQLGQRRKLQHWEAMQQRRQLFWALLNLRPKTTILP